MGGNLHILISPVEEALSLLITNVLKKISLMITIYNAVPVIAVFIENNTESDCGFTFSSRYDDNIML